MLVALLFVASSAPLATPADLPDHLPALAFTDSVVGTEAGRFGLVSRSRLSSRASAPGDTSLAVFGAPIERVTLSLGMQATRWSGGQTQHVTPDARVAVRLAGDHAGTFAVSLAAGSRTLPLATVASADAALGLSVRHAASRLDVAYGVARWWQERLTLEHVVSIRSQMAFGPAFRLGIDGQFRKPTDGGSSVSAGGIQATLGRPPVVTALTIGAAGLPEGRGPSPFLALTVGNVI